jgi:aldehyde dehydrogenase (NAD+)
MPPVNNLTTMRHFFESGATKSYEFRKAQLMKFKSVVEKYETEIYSALYADLKKSPEDCWATENGLLIAEINNAIDQLHHWMEPKKVPTNLLNLPSKSLIMNEPLGVVLIISPWNYPLQLLLKPAVGAMAAGNCMVLHSSHFAPATSALMMKMIEETFDSNYILFVEGDGAVTVPGMMNHFVFDHVMFTGSTAIGKAVYQLAAKELVPVTLELGGKSPCVVEADADIKVAAKRIASIKFSNCGQICIAPDYVLVHESVKEKMVNALIESIIQFYGSDVSKTEHYGKIINEKQFNRLTSYLQQGKIMHGGNHDKSKLFIEPTVMDNIDLNSPIMQEEIFGPILPIISFKTKEEALKIISLNKNPLAFYVFTTDTSKEKTWLNDVAFGGGCVNNAGLHFMNKNLPFGGRGFSGTGRYHGKFSFETFSHQKSVLKSPNWFDPSMKYPPLKGKLSLLKKMIR